MECTLRLVLTLVVSSLLGLAAHSHLAHRAPGSLAEGMCEVVHLAREGTLTTRDTATRVHSVARQTARCACRRGQIAGTSRGRPACVNAQVVHSREWCSMRPCLEGEQCGLLHNRSGWTCSVYGERIKTTTRSCAVLLRPVHHCGPFPRVFIFKSRLYATKGEAWPSDQVKKRRFVVTLTSSQLRWNELLTKGGERGEPRSLGDEGLPGTVVPLEEVVAVEKRVKGSGESKDECYALSVPSQCEAFTVYHVERRPGKRWALQHVTFWSDDEGVPCHRWIQTLNKHVAMQDNVRPQHLLVFINPVGGRCRGEEIYRSHVEPIFKLASINTHVVVTKQANHAKDYILNNNTEAFDGILSVGGDGTFNEVMHGVIEKAQNRVGVGETEGQLKPATLRVGIIPAGSTDCVCFTTIGTNDPVTAALHVVIGDNQPLDVCEVRTDKAFLTFSVTLLGYGFYGDTLRDSENHRWLGPSRYDISGIKTFLRGASYTGRVDFRLATVDATEPRDGKLCRSGCDVCKEAGERLHSQRYQHGLQSNDDEWMSVCGRFTAVNLSAMSSSCARCPSGLSPAAHLASGSADLVLVRTCSRSALLRFLIRHTANQDRFDFPFVETYRVSEVRFTQIAKGDCGDECEEEDEYSIASNSELCRGLPPQGATPNLCCCVSVPHTSTVSCWNCDGEILMQTALNVRVRPRLIRVFARGIEA